MPTWRPTDPARFPAPIWRILPLLLPAAVFLYTLLCILLEQQP